MNAPNDEAYDIINHGKTEKIGTPRTEAVSDEASLLRLASELTEDEERFGNRLFQCLTLGYAKELTRLGSDERYHVLSVAASDARIRLAREHGLFGGSSTA